MRVQEIISLLESFAPPALQESYDNSGLQCGDVMTKATGALLCLDVTEEVLQEAIGRNCNLIIAHHPLIFSPLKKLDGNGYVQRVLLKAIKNDIAIYACHTNADNVRMGVNHKMSEKLGLKNCKVLQPKKGLLKKLVTFVPQAHTEKVRAALFSAGCGHIGNYDSCSYNLEGKGTFRGNEHSHPFAGKKNELHTEAETRVETVFERYRERDVIEALLAAHPYEEPALDIYTLDNSHPQIGSGIMGELETERDEKEFLQSLKDTFKADCVRHTAFTGKKIKKVALCGGSGSFLLKDALKQGADVFITADFKYHQFFEAEGRTVIADIGHYETEQYTPELFYDIISEKMPTFAACLSKHNTNPINYL